MSDQRTDVDALMLPPTPEQAWSVEGAWYAVRQRDPHAKVPEHLKGRMDPVVVDAMERQAKSRYEALGPDSKTRAALVVATLQDAMAGVNASEQDPIGDQTLTTVNEEADQDPVNAGERKPLVGHWAPDLPPMRPDIARRVEANIEAGLFGDEPSEDAEDDAADLVRRMLGAVVVADERTDNS